MPHSAQEWAASVRGTPSIEQLRIALDTSKTPPREFLLKHGQAHLPVPGDPDNRPLNERTRAGQFSCLVEGCGAFQTTVGGPKVRDHFRHRAAPTGKNKAAHQSESLWHQTGKHQLAAWLHECLGPQVLRLEVDTHHVTTPLGSFKPDVYAELDTGIRIAIEYQYSPGDPAVLRQKRQGYQQAGIVDWWFYAPWPRTCKLRSPVAQDEKFLEVNLTATQQNQGQLGGFYWFNPLTETVGTPFVVATTPFEAYADEWWGLVGRQTTVRRRRRPWPNATWVKVALDSLRFCSIDPATGQFISRADRDLNREEHRAGEEVSTMRAHARQQAVAREQEVAREQSSGRQPAQGAGQSADLVEETTPLAGLPEVDRSPRPGQQETSPGEESSPVPEASEDEGAPTAKAAESSVVTSTRRSGFWAKIRSWFRWE